MNTQFYLLIDPDEALKDLRVKNSRVAKVARAIIWHENSRIASKQAAEGLQLNDHERFGGSPKQHFTRSLYNFLPRELRANFTNTEFITALKLLKKHNVAWVFKRIKLDDGKFGAIHMWNLEADSITAVFGWNGVELDRDEYRTMMADYEALEATGSEPVRKFWIDKALEELI